MNLGLLNQVKYINLKTIRIYLMGGRKLLNLLFSGFLGFLFLFALFYILGVKKHHCSTMFSPKKTQLI